MQSLEVLKIRQIVILYNFDIFGCPCVDVLEALENLAPKNTSAFEKLNNQNLPVFPINFKYFK